MNLLIFYDSKASLCGGAERGIRTLGTFYRTHDFQSCALGQLSHLCTQQYLIANAILS